MSDFAKWKKFVRASNEWDRMKFEVIHDPDILYEDDYKADFNAVLKALATIGKNGYAATKGIEVLDSLIGVVKTEQVVKAAAARIKIAKELGVPASELKENRFP